MGKQSRSKRHRSILGIREQDLSPEIVTALRDAEAAFWLLDVPEQHRSIDEMAEMCWNAGIKSIGRQVMNEAGDPSLLDGAAIDQFNERLIQAGLGELLTYVCKELIPRAREFAALNEVYGNNVEGRHKAANESGFALFPPRIADRLCAEYEKELLDLGHRSEAMFRVTHERAAVQMVALIMGLRLIDTHPLASVREYFDRRVSEDESTIEELGRLILSMGIPVLRERLSAGMPIH